MQRLKLRRAIIPAGLTMFALSAGPTRVTASAADAIRVLGFEAPADWTIVGGSISGSTSVRTQGNAALELSAPGFTVITSRLLGPLGQVSPTISFDVRQPGAQPNQYWFGAAQLFVSIPSLGLHNAYLGQRDLTGLPVDAFTTLSYTVPPEVLSKLRQQYFDATFSIVLNVPPGVGGTYLVDNLQVSSTIPGESTISAPDVPRILGLEQADDWSITSGSILGTSFASTQGNFSLAVQPAGYATLTSLPLTAIGPVNEAISLDVRLPAQQPNPGWFGAVQLYASLPSAGVYSSYVGQAELTGLATEQFHTLTFPLSSDLRNALNGSSYSDLRLSIALNAPAPAGVYNIDNIQVGPVTNPAAETMSNLRMDLVGRTSTGVVSLNVEGESASPPVRDALFYIRADDGDCVPSELVTCRFLVSEIRVRTGPFELDGEDFGSALVRNVRPFAIVLGGVHGLTATIPASAQFVARCGRLLLPASSRNLTITVNPSGDGFISVSGSLSGSVDGNSFNISLSLTADTPLLNRMPLANAGVDQQVSASSGCVASATLDGSATVDPDGNLARLSWFLNGTTLYAQGTTVQVPLNRAGSHVFSLLAEDSFGAQGHDQTTVTVSLPAGCP